MSEDFVSSTATKVGMGAVAGIATGVANAAAPHVHRFGFGLANASSNFFNGATKALRSHKGVRGALGAGTAAVIGHGAIATAVVAAAPVAVATVAAGGAVFGIYKLVEYVTKES